MAKAAQNLANNPDLELLLTAIKNEYIQGFIASDPVDKDIREECYIKIATLDDFKTWVDNYGKRD